MSPIVILPAEAPPPPSGLLGVVYTDTFGGLSIAYVDTVASAWDGSPPVMWTQQAASPWSSVGINTTTVGAGSGATGGDITYVPSLDELYWSGTGGATVERVKRNNGASVASITPSAPGYLVQGICYDSVNDEFAVSEIRSPASFADGKISCFIPRAQFDLGVWPITGPSVFAEYGFGTGINGLEELSLAWDNVGAGVLNPPANDSTGSPRTSAQGTVYSIYAAFGLDVFKDWIGTGPYTGEGEYIGTGTGGGGVRNIAINNISGGSTVVYMCVTTGATAAIRSWNINTLPTLPSGGGSALGTPLSLGVTEMPNYDSSGFVWIFDYT